MPRVEESAESTILLEFLRPRFAQGFLVPGKQCGVWLFNSSGKIISEFNPCGLQDPQGEMHEIAEDEEIIGFDETSVEMDLI